MRIFFFCTGVLALVLGSIGIFVPVLPTTPLVMLSAFCFGKASNRFHRWVIGTKIYEKYAKDFIEHKTMTKKRKIFLLTFASVMLLFPLLILDVTLKLIIIAVYIYLYYYFIFKIQTTPKEINFEM